MPLSDFIASVYPPYYLTPLSIVENAGMMGVPMPSMIKKAVDILKDTAESGAR